MALLFNQPAYVRRPLGVVAVRGEDRLSWLHTLLSQRLEDAMPGEARDFLYLDPKGNAIAAGRAVIRADEVLLVTEPEVAPPLIEQLDRMRFLLRVDVADVSAEWALISIRGGDASATPAPLTVEERGGGLVITGGWGGADLLGSLSWVERELVTLGLPEAPAEAWEAWRIAHGEAAWAKELVAGHRPQELGLLPTHVHLKKGCYPGQESVAKTWNLGRPRRALAVLELDARPAGDVMVGDAKARVTSAVKHDGRWLALALLPVAEDGALPTTVNEPAGRVLRKVGDGLAIPGA